MARTIIDVELELSQCNSALQDIVLGKRRTELIIGSGEYQNRYKFQEISPEWLQAKINSLQIELIALTPAKEPVFRNHATFAMVVPKFGSCDGGTN